MPVRDEIESRFRSNLERVENLVALYETQAPIGQGRKPVHVADLLRVAVVLLRASLEDLLRSLAEWKLPTAPAASLEKLRFALPDDSQDKISLADLASFRGQSVDDVIARSIKRHLDRSSYNNLGEVMGLLDKIQIAPELPKELKANLAALMNRHHWIVHRVDRNLSYGAGHQVAQAISRSIVKEWIDAVKDFWRLVLERV